MNSILSTFSSKYQGETMFCFVCVATVFGYILGVNKVVETIISKHSDDTRFKVVQMFNKYTQTNFSEIAELLTLNNVILFNKKEDMNTNDKNNTKSSDSFDNNSEDVKENSTILNNENNENNENVNSVMNFLDNEKKISSPLKSSVLTSEEDYELVKQNENGNNLKNKSNTKYFEWFSIF